MSDMLEQAILDAEKLKESATKLAEQKLIDKYSKEFKETLNVLLEQEDPTFGDVDSGLTLDPGMEENSSEISPQLRTQIPNSGLEPINNISLEEEIEIDFDQLVKQIQNPNKQPDAQNMDTGLAGNVQNQQLEEEISLDELLESFKDEHGIDESEDVDEGCGSKHKKDEYLDEELSMDYETVPTGHAGAPTEKEYQEEKDIHKAMEIQKLEETIYKKNKKLEEYQEYVGKLKEHIAKVNLSNAKLLFTNRVLETNSLNERQKSVFSENIAKAKTVDEAKIIYETIKNTMSELISGRRNKKVPNSLSEAVSRNNALSISKQDEKPKEVETLTENQKALQSRWKILAGI